VDLRWAGINGVSRGLSASECEVLRQAAAAHTWLRVMANEFITNQLNDFQARLKGLRGSL
jgi:hypothetical protein